MSVILKKDLFLARGGERDCYIHPLDDSKVIKIIYQENGLSSYNGKRNEIDYQYFRFLEESKMSFSNISKCYGYIDTNLGKGLIFDKVNDYTGTTSISFLDIVKLKKLSIKQEKELILELKEYIFKNNILFIDYELDNVLCCEYEQNKYRLIIIDGLGAKRIGFKFWLYLKSKTFTKYKIKKQWNKFVNNIEKVRDEK
ncbi:hypothetical protein AAX26_01003 [Aliarcobacter thereius]|uniref:YrbL family protein n=1 Tax=Aliarcobacter thereius TaxID=544718 RepID=UPI000828BF44|nr:YrbL family protein [Aliarcobacter thereius]OCL87906.1 hypothetical protein AAX26_01003 [Aliarcobacter thereius]TLT08331.1 hypothetical protein FE243_00095 [Aliarcobacter thereius]